MDILRDLLENALFWKRKLHIKGPNISHLSFNRSSQICYGLWMIPGVSKPTTPNPHFLRLEPFRGERGKGRECGQEEDGLLKTRFSKSSPLRFFPSLLQRNSELVHIRHLIATSRWLKCMASSWFSQTRQWDNPCWMIYIHLLDYMRLMRNQRAPETYKIRLQAIVWAWGGWQTGVGFVAAGL